jgi:ubiquinone/menaquinone biosynthesis C-methylase UbiE
MYDQQQVITMVRKPTRTTWNTQLDDRPTSNVPRIKFSYDFSNEYGVKNARHMLEVGCGTGSYTKLVDREGCIGIDLEINGLIVAKRHCQKSDFIVCSTTNLPFRNSTFDCVCMWGVLEELPVGLEKQATTEIKRILLTNGIYLVSVYSDHFLSKLFDPAFLVGGVRHYNIDGFMNLLLDMGFRIDKCTVRGRFYTLVSIFLVYFYKHILHKKEGQIKRFIEKKSMQEMDHNDNGIVYSFIAATKGH